MRPPCSTIVGFRYPRATPLPSSTTKICRPTPIWGPASPMPSWSYIVSIMSSKSDAISGVTASTRSARFRSTGSP